MNPIQQALHMLKGFGNGVDQGVSNTYNGVRNTTMGIDRFLGLPDDRQSPSTPQNSPVLGAINAVTNIPSDIAGLFNRGPMINPLAQHIAQAAATTTPTPQVMAAATQAVTPTATPTSIPDPSKLFPDFTTTPVPQQLAPLIHNSAVNAGVDPNVFASLLFSEHGFQTSAGINKNTDGSYDRGIAQINSKAHPEISDQQAIDPNFAIPWAAKLLAHHIKDFGGDYNKGVAAYNVGEGGAADPQTFNNQGKAYLGKIAGGLSDALKKRLGIQSGKK